MEALITKISEYEIPNNLFPGVICCYLLKTVFNFDLMTDNDLENIFIWYAVCILIGRIGSLLVEPVLKKIITFVKYEDYKKAIKINQDIEKISWKANTYRSLLALSLVMLIISFVCSFYYCTNIEIVVCIIMSVIFSLSYRKQVLYVVKGVNICIINS